MKRVRFRYLPGIKRDAFSNARLTGSWDAGGRYSTMWSTTPMAKVTAEDGCTAYEASVDFPDDQAGWLFRWGVISDAPSGNNLWGIPTEVKVRDSTEQVRVFWLDGGPGVQEQDFYLSLSRWLGAQPFFRAGAAGPCFRFAVWAPNARQVEVVMGMLSDATAAAPTPLKKSIPYDQVAGGSIGDRGQGAHPDFAPFPMTKGPDGVWTTDSPSTARSSSSAPPTVPATSSGTPRSQPAPGGRSSTATPRRTAATTWATSARQSCHRRAVSRR
jgi:1,4-alpha-glucan branching enzyme